MFTGLVEEIGVIRSVRRESGGLKLWVEGERVLEDLVQGASVAVQGVCLTVEDLSSDAFRLNVVHETLVRSTLGSLRRGSRINLERATRMGDRLGGHLVQGHVDGLGRISSAADRQGETVLTITNSQALARYIVEKGSIAVDGVSLTVASCGSGWFRVALVPETLRSTTLGTASVGQQVNLEVDLLAKYVENLLERGQSEAAQDRDRRLLRLLERT